MDKREYFPLDFEYELRKKIPELPMRFVIKKKFIIIRSLKFIFVLLFGLICIIASLHTNNSYQKQIVFYIISPIFILMIIVGLYEVMKLIHCLFCDPTWIEITQNGLSFRTGKFYNLKSIDWSEFKNFRFWYPKGDAIQLWYHKKGIFSNNEIQPSGDVRVYYNLKNKSKFIGQKIISFRGIEFDGYMHLPIELTRQFGYNYFCEPDNNLIELLRVGKRHPPLVYFLNEYRKMYSGKNRTNESFKTN